MLIVKSYSKYKSTFFSAMHSAISNENWTLNIPHEIAVCLLALALPIIGILKVSPLRFSNDGMIYFSLKALTFVFSCEFMRLRNNCLYVILRNETHCECRFFVVILPEIKFCFEW